MATEGNTSPFLLSNIWPQKKILGGFRSGNFQMSSSLSNLKNVIHNLANLKKKICLSVIFSKIQTNLKS